MADNYCAGGVCPSWASNSGDYATGKYSGYMTEAPEIFDPNYQPWYESAPITSGLKSALGKFTGAGGGGVGWPHGEPRIQDLEALKEQFGGAEATYIRWMIDKKIDSLTYQFQKQRAGMGSLKKAQLIQLGEQEQAAIDMARKAGATESHIQSMVDKYREEVTPWFGTSAIGQERVEWAEGKTIAGVKGYEEDPLPIPDWMTEYVVYTTQEGTRGREIPTLVPLGAQAKLDPEQLGQMAGLLAYSKAGAPERYSEKALTEMADISRWWQPYQAESQAMFPKQQKLSPRWATAIQR